MSRHAQHKPGHAANQRWERRRWEWRRWQPTRLQWKVLVSFGVAAAAAGLWHAAATASANTDVLVQLTSTPITAHSGQEVTHTVEIAAASKGEGAAQTQMTFSTTVPLENAVATASAGTCQVVSPVSVTCDVNGTAEIDAPVQVTIKGTIPAGASAGQVVYNVANVVTGTTDPDVANNTSSNAYVLTSPGSAVADHVSQAGLSSQAKDVQQHALAVRHASAATQISSWSSLRGILLAVVLAGLIQAGVMLLLRHGFKAKAQAWLAKRHGGRHREARPIGYRGRHIKPAAPAQTRIVIGWPVITAVLIGMLLLTALPVLAEPGKSKPSATAEAKPSKSVKPRKSKAPHQEPAPIVVTTTSAPAPPPPPPAPPRVELPEPAVEQPVDTPAVVEEPKQMPVDAPLTEHAKTVAGLHRTLRRAEYLQQVATRTEADLTTAKAEVARLEGALAQGRDAGKELEDREGTAAILEMALEATQAELKRADARIAALGEADAAWAKKVVTQPVSRNESGYTGGRLAQAVEGEMTSSFGNRFDPYYHRWQLHAGMDIGAGAGTPIRAAAGGEVTQAGWNGGYGNYTCIDHGKTRDERLTTCYAHQSEMSVAVGQKVKAGEVIGKVGNTGASTGPHLHFEVRLGGRPVDPAPWLKGE